VPYIPDINGYCPLDYAGRYGFQNLMAKLIMLSWNRVRQTLHERIHSKLAKEVIDKFLKDKK
jgi:hypothetical protein